MGIDHYQNQRKSFRCAVDPIRQQCELQIGSCAVPAKLLDESVGGFSVLVHHPPELTSNPTVRLRKDGNWINVHVVRIQEIAQEIKHDGESNTEAPVATEPQAGDAESGPCFRLGLRRLGDTELPNQTGFSLLAGTLYFQLSQWKSLGTIQMIVCGALLAVIIVAIPFGMITFGRRIRISKTEGRLKPNIQITNTPSSADADPNHSAFIQDHVFATPSGHTSHSSLLHLPGAAPFALPEVIDRLQLTADQQKQIKQLIEAATKALRKLGRQLQGSQRQLISRRRAELLDLYYQKALDLLTEQQRAEWNILAGGQ